MHFVSIRSALYDTYKEKILKVVKRDGVVAQFDNNRIYLAIQKAAKAASQTVENIVTKRNLYTTRTPDCC